ncbi:hypothetical protein D3C80_1179300 [compost metagenome]
MNFRLGPDIDAPRRFIQNEDARLGQHPATDQHLLLVTAGQVFDTLVQMRRLDPQLAAHLFAGVRKGVFLHKAIGDIFVLQDGDLHVLQNIEDQQTSRILAVLGQERHAVADCLGRTVDRNLFTVDCNTTRRGRCNTEHRLCNIGASRADKTRNA